MASGRSPFLSDEISIIYYITSYLLKKFRIQNFPITNTFQSTACSPLDNSRQYITSYSVTKFHSGNHSISNTFCRIEVLNSWLAILARFCRIKLIYFEISIIYSIISFHFITFRFKNFSKTTAFHGTGCLTFL